MADRKNYTVLVPYPLGAGHWTKKGETLDLLDVQAVALRQAGRIRLTADLAAEAEALAKKTTKKTTVQAE